MGLWLLVVVSVTFSQQDGYQKNYAFQRLDTAEQCYGVLHFIEKDALESKSKSFPQCVYIGNDPKIIAAEKNR